MTRWIVMLAAVLALSALTTPAQAALNACVCTASACGNNAIGGDEGDIFTDLSNQTVEQRFISTGNTGWTCFTPAKTRNSGGPKACYCAGYCGNGGIGADPNYIDLGRSEQEVANLYGGGRPGNPTGWLCGNFRGTVN